MSFPNPDMLVYVAMGDACALGTEYLKFPRDSQIELDILRFDRYCSHPFHKNAPGGKKGTVPFPLKGTGHTTFSAECGYEKV